MHATRIPAGSSTRAVAAGAASVGRVSVPLLALLCAGCGSIQGWTVGGDEATNTPTPAGAKPTESPSSPNEESGTPQQLGLDILWPDGDSAMFTVLGIDSAQSRLVGVVSPAGGPDSRVVIDLGPIDAEADLVDASVPHEAIYVGTFVLSEKSGGALAAHCWVFDSLTWFVVEDTDGSAREFALLTAPSNSSDAPPESEPSLSKDDGRERSLWRRLGKFFKRLAKKLGPLAREHGRRALRCSEEAVQRCSQFGLEACIHYDLVTGSCTWDCRESCDQQEGSGSQAGTLGGGRRVCRSSDAARTYPAGSVNCTTADGRPGTARLCQVWRCMAGNWRQDGPPYVCGPCVARPEPPR